jgi:A nuclease of the HNH/ENDO VII superfamily with conserved LHH
LAALEGSGGVLQDVLKTGSLTPVIQMVQSREKAFESMLSGLPNMIITSLKDFAIKSIVTVGIKKMLTMLVPGGGLVQAAINIYNAVTFFMDRAKQIGAFVQNLTSSFASIAKGDIKAAVKTIEAVLGGGLSLALGFLASAAGLTKIASSIKAALDKIQKPAQAILLKIKDWIVKMFSSLVKKVTPGSKPVAGDKSVSSGEKPNDKSINQDSEVKDKYAIVLNKVSHTLFLEFGLKTKFLLDMQSRRDDLSTKIGRAIASLMKTQADTPLRQEMIEGLKVLGKQAKEVRKGAEVYSGMNAEPESKRSNQRKNVKSEMALLKQGIEKFSSDFKTDDIDENVRQVLENPDMNTLAVLEKWGWVSKSVLGRRMYQKDSLILPTKITNGLTNLQLMQGYFFDKAGAMKLGSKGFSPISSDNKPINLHHLTQDEPGDMVEMDETQHSKFTAFLHGLKKSGQSFRNTPALLKSYGDFQSNYWKERAKDF